MLVLNVLNCKMRKTDLQIYIRMRWIDDSQGCFFKDFQRNWFIKPWPVCLSLNDRKLPRSKFDVLVKQYSGNANVFFDCLWNKVDESFPETQLKIRGFYFSVSTWCRKVQEGIPAKLLSWKATLMKGLYKKLNFRKNKWLLSFLYNSNQNVILNHLKRSWWSLDFYSA